MSPRLSTWMPDTSWGSDAGVLGGGVTWLISAPVEALRTRTNNRCCWVGLFGPGAGEDLGGASR